MYNGAVHRPGTGAFVPVCVSMSATTRENASFGIQICPSFHQGAMEIPFVQAAGQQVHLFFNWKPGYITSGKLFLQVTQNSLAFLTGWKYDCWVGGCSQNCFYSLMTSAPTLTETFPKNSMRRTKTLNGGWWFISLIIISLAYISIYSHLLTEL